MPWRRFGHARNVVGSLCDPKPLAERAEHGAEQTSLQPLEVIPLRLPGPLYCDDQRLPAGYANFLIINGAVIVPQFGDPADDEALRTLAPLFPDRDVRGCPSRNLIWGLGSFHCLSQQEPLA